MILIFWCNIDNMQIPDRYMHLCDRGNLLSKLIIDNDITFDRTVYSGNLYEWTFDVELEVNSFETVWSFWIYKYCEMSFTASANNLHYVTTHENENFSINWDVCIEKHKYKLPWNKTLNNPLIHTKEVHTTKDCKLLQNNGTDKIMSYQNIFIYT